MRSERGSLTAFSAVLALALFALVGLVVDGGAAIAAKRAAQAEAEQAARAGADQLSIGALRGGQVQVDSSAAVSAAEAYAASAGHPATATVSGNTVSVSVVVTEPTLVLSMIGITHLTVSATASATVVHGVTKED
ncbi:MAG: pilus assembly protein TadG-related protein [Acidimicrobiales bacterium]|jgi:Flp pilus assembly protein TadG|nr:pilus assembly protein TadG-related protein [Actinomycetota bacterium]